MITDFNIHGDTVTISGQDIHLRNPSAGFMVIEDADGAAVNYGDTAYSVFDGVNLLSVMTVNR